ncbi:hypothetical protein [Mucilaginibacter jinjuensis]|uniref:Uncharacterized protein n=1 Tax=Mucilaginibacter jinjuensis TaxID=1176721 RepID=A0ABY7T5U4_9SPHI|nr:hypothetical protein [Mucilaginibacter jinjuensis]WCT11530.1 hypothetical protein PQO05_22580 [Mucilaginibacter jinjuensis]
MQKRPTGSSAQNGGTKGHSKPGTGGTQAGPPPPPKPQNTKK